MAESPPTDDDDEELEPETELVVSGASDATESDEEACDEGSAVGGSLLQHPDAKLEDSRRGINGNIPRGRGPGTASGRGYNAERLARVVLGEDATFCSWSDDSWYDSFSSTENRTHRIEVKCCVEQYPSGGSGRFRIWGHNHDQIVEEAERWIPDTSYFLYFFVVYTVEDRVEKEVGKLVATVDQIDAVVETKEWSLRNHDTMGERRAKDISWTGLLDRLEVSEERFRNADAVDVTTRMRE